MARLVFYFEPDIIILYCSAFKDSTLIELIGEEIRLELQTKTAVEFKSSQIYFYCTFKISSVDQSAVQTVQR